ncbi:MAG: hypothetical protein AAGJ85_05635, partial [Pseudomonadota bacterium]
MLTLVKRLLLIALLWAVSMMTAMAQDAPRSVTVGGYINEIHHVDLRTHSYPGDLYIWFRWYPVGDE